MLAQFSNLKNIMVQSSDSHHMIVYYIWGHSKCTHIQISKFAFMCVRGMFITWFILNSWLYLLENSFSHKITLDV